jgi:hypothetical protein
MIAISKGTPFEMAILQRDKLRYFEYLLEMA